MPSASRMRAAFVFMSALAGYAAKLRSGARVEGSKMAKKRGLGARCRSPCMGCVNVASLPAGRWLRDEPRTAHENAAESPSHLEGQSFRARRAPSRYLRVA